jgi:hypothetical protein
MGAASEGNAGKHGARRAGLDYCRRRHKYTYEDQNPPLARVFGAIGPHFAGERWHRESDAYREGYRILGFGRHFDRILSLGRLGILPFYTLVGDRI